MLSFQVDLHYSSLSEAVPDLYISGVSALKESNLNELSITLMINATSEVPNLRCLDFNVHRVKLWLDDTEQTWILTHLEPMADQIDMVLRNNGRVLVYCVAGVSRSATICLAYLTKYRCKSLRDAYHLLASVRPLVRPNLGFWRQLIVFEKQLKNGRSSVRLIKDDAQSGKLLLDVYLKIAIPEQIMSTEDEENQFFEKSTRRRQNSGSRQKFVPVLKPMPKYAKWRHNAIQSIFGF